METSGKIAVITGAGSGIGRATALALYADGFSVVLAGRRREMLEETAALARAAPPKMLVVPTDVADQASIASLFDTVKATYGRIDLLFNNAGISTRNMPFEDLTVEQWSNVVAVNLTGSFLCAQHAFRMMKSQEPRGGRIINSRMQPCRGLVTQGTAIRQRARWRRSLARDQPRAGRMFAGARDDLRHDQGAATGAETPAGLTGSATVKAYVLYIDWRVSSHARPGADVRVIGGWPRAPRAFAALRG